MDLIVMELQVGVRVRWVSAQLDILGQGVNICFDGVSDYVSIALQAFCDMFFDDGLSGCLVIAVAGKSNVSYDCCGAMSISCVFWTRCEPFVYQGI